MCMPHFPSNATKARIFSICSQSAQGAFRPCKPSGGQHSTFIGPPSDHMIIYSRVLTNSDLLKMPPMMSSTLEHSHPASLVDPDTTKELTQRTRASTLF